MRDSSPAIPVSFAERLLKSLQGRLILASASPRRKEILAAAGFQFDVVPSAVEERQRQGEAPEAFVLRVAEEKALDVLAKVPPQRNAIVLGADTIVVIDEEILGKPTDAADAKRMLRQLSGREHRVLTGVCLAAQPLHSKDSVSGKEIKDVRVASTEVNFAVLSEQEIDDYILSGEPFDKAGAYAIQGGASKFVEGISGDYFNVVGLPIALVCQMLQRLAARQSS